MSPLTSLTVSAWKLRGSTSSTEVALAPASTSSCPGNLGWYYYHYYYHPIIIIDPALSPPTDLARDPSLSTKEDASRRSRESATQPPTRYRMQRPVSAPRSSS